MNGCSLQIQSILYHNNKDDLVRSMTSISRAIELNHGSTQEIGEVKLCYGDASQEPLFTDSEISNLQERFGSILHIEYQFFNENTGTAKGHNILGENCSSQYMLVMNPDVIVIPRLFTAMMHPFKTSELNVGLVEARQTPIEHPKEYNINTGETGWATTACALFPTNIFHILNGFDADSFFLYCDDVDFSWRIRLLGKKIIYRPSALVYHAKTLSANASWEPTSAEVYYSAEAALMMAYKWSNDSRLKKILHIFTHSTDENLINAALKFQDKASKCQLPERLDAKNKVAEFVGDYYTTHRYTL